MEDPKYEAVLHNWKTRFISKKESFIIFPLISVCILVVSVLSISISTCKLYVFVLLILATIKTIKVIDLRAPLMTKTVQLCDRLLPPMDRFCTISTFSRPRVRSNTWDEISNYWLMVGCWVSDHYKSPYRIRVLVYMR